MTLKTRIDKAEADAIEQAREARAWAIRAFLDWIDAQPKGERIAFWRWARVSYADDPPTPDEMQCLLGGNADMAPGDEELAMEMFQRTPPEILQNLRITFVTSQALSAFATADDLARTRPPGGGYGAAPRSANLEALRPIEANP